MKQPNDKGFVRQVSIQLAALAAASLFTSPSSKPRYQKPVAPSRRRKFKGWQREQRRNNGGKARK